MYIVHPESKDWLGVKSV